MVVKQQEEKTATPPIQMKSFIFGKTDDSPFKSLKELKTEYAEKRKQSLNHIFLTLPQIKEISNTKVHLQSAREPDTNILKLVVTSGKKASEVKVALDQVSLPDKINLHKQSSDILYAELLQLAINHSKDLAKIDKLELRLKQEQTTSKSHLKQIKSLESYLATDGSDQKDAKALQELLDNKDTIINELKGKLKIPPTQVLQTRELTEVEQEKDHLQQRVLVLNSQVISLKQENESLLKKLEQVPQVTNTSTSIIVENNDLSTEEIVAAMSQVQLKDIEISELQLENDKLKKDSDQNSEKITKLEEEKQSLEQKIEDLRDRLKGKIPLIGAKHLIWDSIIDLTVTFRPYLDMVEDKAALTMKALQKCAVVNETMTKRTSEIAQNAINVLNTATNEQLQALGIKDRITTMIWARKVICKHTYMNNVKGKAEDMRNFVQKVKDLFKPLFQIGLPSFWDSLGKLVPKEEYRTSLLSTRMDSSSFRGLEGNLSGSTIFNKLSNDFQILHQFKSIKDTLPPMSYTECIELEILYKEMGEYEMLSEEQWKQVERLGRAKYRLTEASTS